MWYMVIDARSVVAEVLTPLRPGSRLELAVRGDSSAEAAVRLVQLLRACEVT